MSPGEQLTPVVRLAPAKLNLTLAVTGRRRDGFHELHSVMVPLALADRLSFAPAAGRVDSLHVVGGPDGRTALDPAAFGSVLHGIAEARRAVGRGADTLRARGAVGEANPQSPPASRAGAATAPRPSRAPWTRGAPSVSMDDRRRAAAAIGSDVPFFLAEGPALVEGRGEKVTPLNGFAGARARRPPRHARRGGVHPRSLRTVRRRPARRATAARFHAPVIGAPGRGARSGLRPDGRGGPRAARRRARDRERPGPRGGPAGARPARTAAGVDPAARRSRSGCPAPVRPCGRSILRLGARRKPPPPCASQLRLGLLDSPGEGAPFVAATTIVSPPRRTPG